jgi:uncharacterized protein (TIGR02271 family)
MDNANMDRIVPLDNLPDFHVASGDPDVRGWEVCGSDGKKIGEVDQLLIDTEAMKVRYLDVDVDDSLLAGSNDRHVLIPIGYARLDIDDDRIIVDQLQSSQVSTLPEYNHGTLTRDFEDSVRQPFLGNRRTTGETTSGLAAGAAGGIAGAEAKRDFYAHESFDENRFFGARRGEEGRTLRDRDEARVQLNEEQLSVGKRREQDGVVDIHKRVDTEHVRRQVPLSHEEAIVERRPITGDRMSTAADISEEEIRVPLSREEAVVEKRVVPSEELVVKKRNVTEQETVEADLRRERAEIEREGDAPLRDFRAGKRGEDRSDQSR